MKQLCDLHSHSNCSDGSLSPQELVSLAEQQGLSALALTDHNTAKGLPAFMEAGEKSSVQTVAGCEFSAEYDKKEYHIVGLFLPEPSWAELEDFVQFQHMAKHHSNELLIKRLNEGGYALTYEEVAALTDADEFNRAHVARTLFNKGYVSSVEEAFQKLLCEECGYYKPPKRLSVAATIRFIKNNGGVAVWAHPFFSTDEATILKVLPAFIEAGLDAMETVYTTYSEDVSKRAKEIAASFGLKESGGSDFHGEAKPDIALGKGRGNLEIPLEFLENLAER